MQEALPAMLSLLAGASLAAAEPIVRDLTVDIELLPAEFEFQFRSAELDLAADDAFDSALGAAVGVRYGFNRAGSRHGLILGGQLTAGQYGYDATDSTYATYGLRATAGYGFALSDRWTLLVEPMVEYGLASWDLAPLDLEGDYWRYGGELRVAWAMSEAWIVNLHGGWMHGESNLDDGDRSLEVEHQGPLLGLGIAWRWSAAPRRLE